MNRKKAISIQSKLDIIQLLLNIIVGIVLVPYYLKFISVEIYGFWLATSGVVILLDVFDLGISTVFTERLSKFFSTKQIKLLLDYFFSGIFLHLVIALFIVSLGILLSSNLGILFSFSSNEKIIVSCFQIAILTSGLRLLNSGMSNLGYSLLLPLNYSVSRIISLILGIYLVLEFLNSDYGLYSIAYSYLIQQIFCFFCNSIISFKLIFGLQNKFKINIKSYILIDFMSSLKHLFFARSGESIVKNIEPVIIGSSIGAESTAIYVFAKKVSDTIYQLVNTVTGSAYASLVNLNQEKNIDENDERIEKLNKFIFYSSMVLLSFFISLNKDFIKFWVGKDFIVSTMLSSLFAISTFMMIWIQFKSIILYSKNKIRHVSIVLFFESILRLLLLYILFNYLKLFGGPLAIIISTFFGIYLLDRGQKIDKISFIICVIFFVSAIVIASIKIEFTPIINILIRGLSLSAVMVTVFLGSKKFRNNIIKIANYIVKK